MLLRHTAIYMVSKTLPAMAGIITTMLLTRLLTPAKYGVVGLGACHDDDDLCRLRLAIFELPALPSGR